MAEDKPKRKGIPKPPKPPIQPYRGQKVTPDISMSHERLIGRVVSAWAKLETVMQQLVWTLTGLSFEDGRTLTGRQGPDWLIAVLRSLAERYISDEGNPSQRHKLLDILDIVDQRRVDRNDVVHGSWGRMDGAHIVGSLRSKTPDLSNVTTETFNAARLRAIVDDINRCGAFIYVLTELLEASRETPPGPPPEATGDPEPDQSP
jgi:hypothetical protein